MAGTISKITFDDGSKKPYRADNYADMRGIVDFGNLIQFAPFEKGYALLAPINGAAFMDYQGLNDGRKDLQDAFLKILEQEFKGLDGIDDITSENMDITDNISTLSMISKVTQPTNGQITMRFTEKSGSLITKYCGTFLRFLKDSHTQARTYGGAAVKQGGTGGLEPSFDKEVLNLLYIVTDSSILNVEKAFLLLNMQPTTAAYSELYNSEKGDIGTVEISIPFNVFAVDGMHPNILAQKYLDAVICNSLDNVSGKININSWKKDWSVSSSAGVTKASGITVANGKLTI
jgi:hypothetical protein